MNHIPTRNLKGLKPKTLAQVPLYIHKKFFNPEDWQFNEKNHYDPDQMAYKPPIYTFFFINSLQKFIVKSYKLNVFAQIEQFSFIPTK